MLPYDHPKSSETVHGFIDHLSFKVLNTFCFVSIFLFEFFMH